MAETKAWLADRIRKLLPRREELERSRLLRPVAHLLLQPALWRFTRRSVPRAVGLGLLVGVFVMIPFVQPVSAALLAIPLRANVPLAAGTTLLTNPVTTPFLIIAALWIGSDLFGFPADPSSVAHLAQSHASLLAWGHWLLSSAAPALVSGLALISTSMGLLGFVLATIGWRLWVGHKWRRRSKAHSHL